MVVVVVVVVVAVVVEVAVTMSGFEGGRVVTYLISSPWSLQNVTVKSALSRVPDITNNRAATTTTIIIIIIKIKSKQKTGKQTTTTTTKTKSSQTPVSCY